MTAQSTTDDRAQIVIEDETLRAGFTTIPNAVLKRPDISPGAKLCYVMLLTYAWQDESCFPGQARLATDMGSGERSVTRYLKELHESGLITIKRRGLGLTNRYILHHLARDAKMADQGPPKDRTLESPYRPSKKTQRKRHSSSDEKDHDAYRRSAETAGFNESSFFGTDR